MSEGLQKVSGERLRTVMRSMAGNRFKGVFSGTLVTAVIQSSSATTVMVVSFVNAGLLTLRESIGVIMGANLGTTTTAWIIAALGFKLELSSLALPLVGFFSSSAYYLLVILSAIQLPFINFSMLGLIILRYEKKNLLFTYQVILKVVLLLLSVFVFVVFMDGGLEWVLICQLLTLVLTSIVLYTNIKQYLLFSFSWKNLMMSFSYALPQFPARVGSVMMVYSNRLFMVFFLTTSIIGLYSFSLKLASGVQILGTAFMMAWLPFMYQQFAKENHRLLFAKFMPLVSCFLFLLVSVLSLLSEDIVSIVAGPDFFYSYKYIGSLSLYFALTIIKEVIDIGPKYTEKTKYVSYNYFVSLIVNVVSMYLFIVFWRAYPVISSLKRRNIPTISFLSAT